jgi:hypothetical protein
MLVNTEAAIASRDASGSKIVRMTTRDWPSEAGSRKLIITTNKSRMVNTE